MRIIKQKIYTFNELEASAKKYAIAQYRENSVDYEWYIFITDEYTQRLDSLGFSSPEIYFTGFCSQGDGACFDATLNMGILGKNFHPDIIESMAKNGWEVEWTIAKNSYANHYSHERTRYIHYSTDCQDKLILDLLDREEQRIESLRLKLCREIYRALELEWDTINSDEYISDTLSQSDMEFYETGRGYY